MRPSARDDVASLLQSAWSSIASRSRRAIAGAESLIGIAGQPQEPAKEYVYLLPAWAVKRRRRPIGFHESPSLPQNAFDLHVSLSGFAVALRDFSAASTAQRAVISVAKRFAALPKLPISPVSNPIAPLGTADDPEGESAHREGKRPSSSIESLPTTMSFADPRLLHAAHSNLDARLSPFWSKAITSRDVKLSLFTIDRHRDALTDFGTTGDQAADTPLITSTTSTDEQGLFSHHIVIPWERICAHPTSGSMMSLGPASGMSDWQLRVEAEVSEPPDWQPEPDTQQPDREMTSSHQVALTPSHTGQSSGQRVEQRGRSRARIKITVSEPKGVRIISDLDDTIKHSDILAGPREVFRNVFCRSLEDVCVPGMADLYRALQTSGVDGFHMISNSPFELYTSIRDFMSIHRFPAVYSLKLKYYGGRSLLSSLMEPAGDRKKPAILEVLEAFPESKFILFGDSGEQDLEVYSAVAHSRPHQISAIYIRDITSGRADAIDILGRSSRASTPDSAILAELDATAARPSSPQRPSRSSSTDTLPDESYFDELRSLSSAQQKILRRAALWDIRVEKARRELPPEVRLIFFTDASAIKAEAVSLVQGLSRSERAEQ